MKSPAVGVTLPSFFCSDLSVATDSRSTTADLSFSSDLDDGN